MMLRRLIVSLTTLAFALGCGKTTPAAEGPKQTEEVSSVEAACLEDAATPRTPAKDAPERIEVAHVLVRHRDLKRPEGASRSRGQACLRALKALEALQGGTAWGDTVREFSDSGVATEGALGAVSREQLTPAFGNAAFALSVDELSYVVESDRGFHVIVRTQ